MATGDSSADPTTFCPARVPNATIYSPLDPGQIRVLHLQPARKLTAPLVGVFETIQIGSDAGYEALSYTWDEAFEEPKVSKLRSLKSSIRKSWMQESIFSTYKVKRGEIRIHEVAVATTANLHVALRRLRYSRKARTLWVDAICINQGDLVERSTQVACMEQIFSGASQVVAFAPSAMLKCGALEIPWSTFINALGVDLSFDRDTIGTLSKIPEERHAIRLMTMLSPWKCLDKRDVIYSVASILKLCPDCPQIMIDYSLDWPTVYTRFTRDYIQLNGYIAAWNILGTAGLHLSSPSRCRRLPHASETHSWVPDWADFDQGGWLSQTHIRYNLLGHRYYIYGNNKKVVCDDHSIKIDLQYLGQMGISRASDKELLWNDCYYHLLTEWTSVQQYVVLILRRCGEQDMTFQLVGCEFLAPCEWDMEPEVHRVTII